MEQDIDQIRSSNRDDAVEIEKLQRENDDKGRETANQQGHIRQLEYDIAKDLDKVNDLQRQIDQKNYELKQKDQQL